MSGGFAATRTTFGRCPTRPTRPSPASPESLTEHLRRAAPASRAALRLGMDLVRRAAQTVMRMRGLEPPRGCPHTDLNRARLPIPPHPRAERSVAGRDLRADGRLRAYHEAPAPPRPLLLGLTAVVALLVAAGGASARSGRAGSTSGLVEVVVTLPRRRSSQAILRDRVLAAPRDDAPPPGRPRAGERLLPAHARRRRSGRSQAPDRDGDPATRRSAGATASCSTGSPSSSPAPSWRRSRAIPGATVWPSVTYHSLASRQAAPPQLIGATTDLGADARHRRQGHEDRDHRRRDRPDAPVLRPDRLHVPGRLPEGEHGVHDAEGDRRARVRAARARRGSTATTPFDPQSTPTTRRTSPGSPPATTARTRRVDAAASPSPASRPPAYLGNYKVLTVPTTDFGLDGNSPEIAAGIEAAVKDGMDVINLSLGEPEIEPQPRHRRRRRSTTPPTPASCRSSPPATTTRTSGRGSSARPASAPQAITVAASTEGDGPRRDRAVLVRRARRRSRSQMKPDVTRARREHPLVGPARDGLGRLGRDEHGDAARRRARPRC